MSDYIRWAIDLEYAGANYSGSQIQALSLEQADTDCKNKKRTTNPHIITIQGELEKVLCTLIKKNTTTIFSGRTDAGVNAYQQTVHFDTQKDFVSLKMLNSINALLPNDISAKNLRRVDCSFHSQKSAKWRWYRYVIVNRAQRSVWDYPSLLVKNELNVVRLNESLKYLEGEHDFSAFKCLKTGNPAKICHLYKAVANKVKRDIIFIDIVADRFLYNMIRIIVGTLLYIENNSLSPSVMSDILNSKNRLNAGQTVSPVGLYLMKVDYETNYEKTNMEAILDENLFS